MSDPCIWGFLPFILLEMSSFLRLSTLRIGNLLIWGAKWCAIFVVDCDLIFLLAGIVLKDLVTKLGRIILGLLPRRSA